ncbi:MAG: xanthine dehydrogenase family protein molybdopterin-binding subunit [Planctomycetes bacterium]|nr:xanthine dehydrogenase family protein molybdopterin-binding subunit [Planctomycetota bacterium]
MAQDEKDPVATWPARENLKVLNHDLVRVDARAKVTGAARYTHDVRVPGMAYARLLLAPLPALKIKKLDLAPALKIPGVLGAVALETDRTRWLGEPIAAVAATTPERAEDGLRAILLEYEREPWAIDEAQATAPNAPKVRSNAPKVSTDGDQASAERACEGAAAVIEATYTVPVQHHVCLETHGVVVDYKGGDEATVWCSTQSTFGFTPDAAKELGLKASRVTGLVEYMGGGFGAKFGLGLEGQAACKLSKEIKRPVHLMMTRRDEFLAAGNRTGGKMRIKLAASQDGTLVGMVADRRRFGGIGNGSMAKFPYIYAVENAYSETLSVPMNLDSNRAMRAPGHPQAGFGMESALDELAYKLGVDPLEMRKRNLKDKVYHRQLERVAREIGWYEHPHRDKPGDPKAEKCIGIGFGVAVWGGGGGGGTECEVRIERDGSVSAAVGTQDLGTGSRTYVAAITAEELGLRLEDVTAHIGSTRLPSATGSGGSTTTGSLAPAVKVAAFNAARAFAARLAPVFGVDAARVQFAGGEVRDTQGAKPALSWKQACAMLPAEGLSARGEWTKDANKRLAASGIHGAQAARVEVDTQTGRVRVLDMIAMQDCGLPLNRLAVVSQVNGGMVQALSYALHEERNVDAALGVMLNSTMEGYKIAGSLEMPRMVTIIDDEDERGVIGVAEATCIPGHSAIANAVFNACGARVRDLPLTPDKVLFALGKVV